MHASTAVSSSQPGTFDAANSSARFDQHQLHAHRQSHLSTADSVVTLKRPGSLSRADTQPDTDSRIAIGRGPMSNNDRNFHKRRRSSAIESSNTGPDLLPSASEAIGLASVNRYSHSTHSTNSSVASLSANTRRKRSSSGAVLTSLRGQTYTSPRQKPPNALDASPRSSPQRQNVTTSYSPVSSPERRRPQARAGHLTALPPLHTTPALTDSNDTESPSTSQTLETPLGPSYVHGDYFDDGYGMAKTKRVVMVRNPSAPVTIAQTSKAEAINSHNVREKGATSRLEMEQRPRTTAPEGNGHRRPRNRERTERDKKAMLSKALQKANTAVLLDNAQNYEGALEAYSDACDLLTQVMERTSGEDDKRKLDAIRVTYSNRMDELNMLVQERPPTADERPLPARPMSGDSGSLRAAPVSPLNGAVQEQDGGIHSNTPRGHADAPRLSYSGTDRDSFFARTMEAVETSFTSEANDSQAPAVAGAEPELATTSIHLPPPLPEDSRYMPRPLSPKRPSPTSAESPKLKPQSQTSWNESPEQRTEGPRTASRQRAGSDGSKDTTSWLDPLDESGSSSSDSVHSRSSLQGTRRKHLRRLSGESDADFDVAFDAAVEAAYDEGFEPDLDARTKRKPPPKHVPKDSIQVPASEIEEILPGEFHSGMMTTEEDEEEERILDELASDYGGAFDFDLKSKSAIPRQSDSSAYTRSTWQSSQVSNRDTAATSLSTVAEDAFSGRLSKPAALRESTALPPPSGPPPPAPPPRSSLPQPPNAGSRRESNVRSRGLSGMNAKQLKIETAREHALRKRASTFHHTTSPFLEGDETNAHELDLTKLGEPLERTVSETQHGHILLSPSSLELHAAPDKNLDDYDASTTTNHRPSYEEAPGDLPPGTRPTLFRKNKSSVSLREHAEHQILLASPDVDSGMSNATPMSSTFMSFAARRHHPLASQRAQLSSYGPAAVENHKLGGGYHLFDTALTAAETPLSPTSPSSPLPAGLESCPESFLLRPFWLMRALSSTIVHPRGGFLTANLFVSRQVWETSGVKLKLVDDKIANCDLLTAALGHLAGVDTFDADAVMEELQSFEEVMERVQQSLIKKLGSDVGVHGIAGMFKDASAVASSTGTSSSDATGVADKAAKSNSGKSYLTSWRKLRNKSSGTPLSGGAQVPSTKPNGEKEMYTMQSVPMTSFVPVERRGNKREARNLVFEGPNKEYMGSLARLFDGVQILDQIARQVEDPGLKYSSPTHVGLELSIRHAAEFFGFFVCRFVLADLGLLMDKFLKRGTEWVLA
ncbi:uncharacterized protein MYCFIDRAFT_87510 [Pseudocercospora fijiensis CIRAD86]|uniref:MIT domain-containing protein n=1 Tax=Pseudocercospora fijiensis (strain CIRAD86) TaxID=383855 RepID=M3ATE4_PSEFD|nr:uncharacterized protein MYCFIDRAFT_87510 [Pseudocercospora fijiensis CIRAD86]EME80737.1 hypothetical protein MYCFIDRAFT_87510 [Pseudocercospora fijiensis CIRAD86]